MKRWIKLTTLVIITLLVVVLVIFLLAGCPLKPPENKLTLVSPTGGTVIVEPDKTVFKKGEKVELTAKEEEGWVFDHWVINGEVAGDENPKTIEMNEEKIVEAVFEQNMPPAIVLNWTGGNLMTFEAPCTAPEEGLIFEYKVGNPEDTEVASATWKVEDPDGNVIVEEEIIPYMFYSRFTEKIEHELFEEPVLGGKYILTIEAANIYGTTSEESLEFYVHSNLASLEGTVLKGEVLEATVSLDSKVRIVVYAYKTDIFDCEDPTNEKLIDQEIFRNKQGEEKLTFELDLSELGEEYNKLRIILYNPLCGSLPCGYCPDDEEDLQLVRE